MRIVSLRSVEGPNVFHHLPVVIMRVDLEHWADKASNGIPNFNENLKSLLPGMYEHTCSPGKAGGFFERLERGTYLAHITEHVALEIANLAGLDIGYGKSRYAGAKGLYDIILRSPDHDCVKECLKAAAETVDAILNQEPIQIDKCISEIVRKKKETALGLSGNCIYKAAKQMGIPVKRIGSNSLLQLGYGKNQQHVQAAVTSKTSLISADIVQDKEFTKNFLSRALIPTPFGVTIREENEIDNAIKDWPGPYVLKPIDGNHGRGVFLNLQNAEEIKSAFRISKDLSSAFLIEKMQFGKDYRVLVIDGKFIAAAERIPPQVFGDGKHNIAELIEMVNQDPLRGEGHESFFTRIVPDGVLLAYLKKQNLTLKSVVKSGEVVQLRGNANLSSGGTAVDVTAGVSEEIKLLCERISRIVGLDICGIDIVAKDLSSSMAKNELTVIEVNAGPGLRMHLLGKGEGEENIGRSIINMLYKNPSDSRIPIVSVTGTNGKTTVVRMLHHIMSDTNQNSPVGMTNTDGIWIGKNKIASGDMSGPISASILLQDSSVASAVFEVARGGLLRSGLAYDWSDVAVYTNISEDHLGQDGIETVDDILWIKSLVGERVKKNGTLVLNADNFLCLKLLENITILNNKCKFILYSTKSNNEALMDQISCGSRGIWVEDGHIILADKFKVRSLGYVADIPITLNGKADFQISNTLAAIGGAVGIGIETEQIMRSLKEFNPTTENRGRLNLYKIRSGYVIVDYGHNPDAIASIGELVNKFSSYAKTAILGLPGDRTTDLIKQSARQAAKYFNNIILRDEIDLRGRSRGEIPSMLSKMYKEEFPNFQHEVILDERDAVYHALNQLNGQSILVIFCEDIINIQTIMNEFKAILVSDILSADAIGYANIPSAVGVSHDLFK
ncbi:MAG: cyanophycin synthetase [Bdellovibrio sp.]